jgi:hypothetical protein
MPSREFVSLRLGLIAGFAVERLYGATYVSESHLPTKTES